jgi:hypothetical protein
MKIPLLFVIAAIYLIGATFSSVSCAQEANAGSLSPSPAVTQTAAAPADQSPARTLIAALQAQRDLLPIAGTDSQKEQRNILDKEIAALDQADATTEPSASPSRHDEIGSGSIGAIFAAVLVVSVVTLLGGLAWKKASEAAVINAKDDAYARVRLALAVTLGAMTFIVLVSVVMLLFAGINAALPPWGAQKTQLFFEMGKWILGAVLPVVGAWVGGVLAYYFGKDNFNAGVQSTTDLVKQLTPQQKLASRKAGESGLTIGNIKPLRQLGPAESLGSVDLQGWQDPKLKFGGQERLPILDAIGCPLACLHYSTLANYLVGLKDAEKQDATAMTLGELMKRLPWDANSSIATVWPGDDLSGVQTKLNDSKSCADVFVTADGTKTKPAQRWITDQDIVAVANM